MREAKTDFLETAGEEILERIAPRTAGQGLKRKGDYIF